MPVRTTLRRAALLGILIGAGGCSSDSPTAPFEPSSPVTTKSGYIGSGNKNDSTVYQATATGGGLVGTGNRTEPTEAGTTTTTTSSTGGGLVGTGN